MTNLEEIVAKLKTGTIKNVVPYGSALPAPPYIVVKEEPAPGLGYTRYRIIVHMAIGQVSPLAKYVRKDLYSLLSLFSLHNGGLDVVNQVDTLENISALIAENSDGTIAQERLFYVTDLF